METLQAQRRFNVLKPTILSFRGKARSGKTTAATYYTQRYSKTVRLAFADALKVEVYDRCQAPDLEMDTILEIVGLADYPYLAPAVTDEDKIEAINAEKGTLRPLLQYYGTEYRRGADPRWTGSETYWIDRYLEKALAYMAMGLTVVTDDARFPNEREAVRDLGGFDIFILRPDRDTTNDGIPGHASEALNDPHDPDIDYIVVNSFSTERFYEQLETTTALIPRVQWSSSAVTVL